MSETIKMEVPNSLEVSKSHAIENSSSVVQVDANAIERAKQATFVQNINQLKKQCEVVDQNLHEAEAEVIRKKEEAFLIEMADNDLLYLQRRQEQDIEDKKRSFNETMKAREARKSAKGVLRQMSRDTRMRDLRIQQQNTAQRIADEIQKGLEMKRRNFEKLLNFKEAKHEKQLDSLVASQKRRIQYDREMVEIECAQQKNSEAKNKILKRHESHVEHQGVLDKRVCDQLREVQQLEIRHAKQRSELEIALFEEVQQQRLIQLSQLEDLDLKKHKEVASEKEKLLKLKEHYKATQLQITHDEELRRISSEHKIQLRKMKQSYYERISYVGSKGSSASSSKQASNASSKIVSRSGSNTDLHNMSKAGSSSNTKFSNAISDYSASQNMAPQSNDLHILEERMQAQEIEIHKLTERYKELKNQLLMTQKDEFESRERIAAERMRSLEADQETEMIALLKDHETEITELKNNYNREMQMQQEIHEAEYKAMVERKILSSVFDSVVDGIVNIDSVGTITKFNEAAEKMFGYKSHEIIGKDIKTLMPERYAVNHDNYLSRYLTTGVKRVIGSSRQVMAKRKDNSEFPIHLSLSEVKQDGVHIFTGIVRDMTKEEQNKRIEREKNEAKQKQLNEMISQLDRYKMQATTLISHMLPESVGQSLLNGVVVPPQNYESATVFFCDIVGFTEISKNLSPEQTVLLLNILYVEIDKIISKYDAYKVETVGDSYMIVSGLPKPNAIHASEIATMALEIISFVYHFVIPDLQDTKIQLRIGINTGPVVSGIVGKKMPRYCLFGDTVNTAARMESTGQANKVQITETTYNALMKSPHGFKCTLRGEVTVKGKGSLKTYWLTGRDKFPYELPPMQ